MSTFTLRLLLILACTLGPTLSDCARPLQDTDLILLRLPRTLPKGSWLHLSPAQLSPARRGVESFSRHSLTTYQTHTSLLASQEYELKSDKSITTESQTKASDDMNSRVDSDRKAAQQQRLMQSQLITYNSILHKNPAGPNPIGNEYGPVNTIHNVKKYRYPPQG